MMRKFWREPLVHFLIGALLVFAFFWATGLDRDTEDTSIVIDQSSVARLAADWQRTYNRAPTKDELDTLIDQQITEEIYYREALRLGLDRGDPVVRRRLFTKMRFLEEEESASEPTEAELQKWLEDNAARYAAPGNMDVQQIYLGQGPAPSRVQLKSILDGLNAGKAIAPEMARNISLPEQMTDVSPQAVTREFGEKFMDGLQQQPPGKWTGPVQSSFGNHLVKYTQRSSGEALALTDVRQRVENDWRRARLETSRQAQINKLRAQYDITVAGRE